MINQSNYSHLRMSLLKFSIVIIFLLSNYFAFAQAGCAANLGTLPSVFFKSKSVKLLPDAKLLLEGVAAQLRDNPTCKIVVNGYCSSSKNDQQRSWDLVNNVINYLVEQQGISSDRFIFVYGGDGDCNIVDLRVAAAGEDGPSSVPPPHPALRKKN
jgi:hypothetical protein